ncbi:MAG: ATP-binding cassette domain-containing protein [Bacilli bacterium]|nr:ATP-binding cassette domain-containing protein [Bacilli bacterium]
MLEIKKISKIYITGDFKQTALDEVSISFRKNEFASILGPSGSGKTTLLNIIGGLDNYDKGDLIINNVSTKKYTDRDWDSYRNHRIGFVFQSYNLIGHQSVLANVELALTLSGVSKKERTRRAKKALDSVGLSKHIHKKPNQLSGGQMQRVAIARALVNDPDILLADEPTGALDSETSKQIMEILANVAKDRLVIMVTHNPDLAKEYSTRIIKLKDGKVIDDTNPYNKENEKLEKNVKTKKTSMSLLTALSLSLNNLMTKKGRTFLTAFAGSIGIIGIALILSLSNGVQEYIDKTERETLASYPLTIEKTTFDIGASMNMQLTNNIEKECEEGKLCTIDDITTSPAIMAVSSEVKNNLKEFKKALDDNYHSINDYTDGIGYSYNINLLVYSKDTSNGVKKVGDVTTSNYMISGNPLEELIDNDELLKSQYEIIAGHMPENYNELVLVLDKNGNIPLSMLYNLNILDGTKLNDTIKEVKDGKKESLETPEYTYEDLIGLKYSLIYNNLVFEKVNGKWTNIGTDKDKLKNLVDNGLELEIVGVVKVSSDTTAAESNFVGYSHDLIKHVIDKNNDSEIVKEQLANKNINIFTGYEFDADYPYDAVTYMLGMADLDDPSSINIYPKNYDSKDKIKDIINEYNNEQKDEFKITYTDYVGVLMSGITNIINVITYILVAFVAISLIVSSIMISIITYISVLERTKEIGILRAIGASKKDVTRVFNAETIIEGFVAGVFGILVTLLLCVPINAVVYGMFNVNNIAKLPVMGGIILIGISVLLTVIAGLVPSRMAAKKDPVESLRTE